MKQSFFTAILAILSFNLVSAQSTGQSDDLTWGAEFNLVWPFVPGVEIYTAKLTSKLWQSEKMSGDILMGILVRPGTRNDPNAEVFPEFGVGLGYRQYIIKGFHLEIMLFPSYARELNNFADGRDYSSFAMTTELYGGYRFDLVKTDAYRFYLMPQAGAGMNVFSNLGPETETNAPFPVLSLQIGFNF